MRTFLLRIDGWAKIELDEQVIDVVDDEWRRYLYQLDTPEEIAAHVGYNLAVNRIPLSMMDGWADQPDKNARIVDIDWEVVADVADEV